MLRVGGKEVAQQKSVEVIVDVVKGFSDILR